jgi:cytochrome c556
VGAPLTGQHFIVQASTLEPVMKKTVLLALVACALPFTAQAQFAKPEDAIKYRQSAFSVMGTHFGRIGAVVRGDVPFNAAQVTANAEIVAMMSKLPYTAFAPGTETGNTKAKAEIWKEKDKFDKGAADMQDAVGKLLVAARGGNLDDVKKAFGAAGQTCKACHDEYRAK